MEPFAWVEPPLRNAITRLAIEADPQLGTLKVRGYEETAAGDDARPATADFALSFPM